MKKHLIAGILIFLVLGVTLTAYLKKHPNLDNFKNVEASWLSPSEKKILIFRLAGMACDQTFKKSFIKGTAILSEDVAEMDEQLDSYVLFRNVSIINGKDAFQGRYVCTYYKSGRDPYLMASFDRGASELLLNKK